MLAHSVRANGFATARLWLDLASVPASLREAASAGSVRGTIDPFTRQTSSPSDAPLSRPSRCAPMPFIVSHHRAQISPCPEPPAPAASCDATLPPRTALASDPNAFCRFDPRCASRYEPSRHELALVSSGRGPYAESGFAQEPALAAPPIRLFRDWIVDCSLEPVITRSSAVEARSRARSAWDASGGDPGPFDRHMQPTRFIFNDESDRLGSFRIVFPRDSGASGSTPAARFGGPCTAFQQLCAPRHFLRVTPHGVPLTSLVCSRRERSGRAPRPHIARAPSRAPSRRVNGRAGRFDSGRLPLFSCLWPQPTNRPKRVALDRSSRTIARATQKELLQLSPTLGHFSAPQAPASHESGNARPKPGAPSSLRFTREEDKRRHPRAGEM